MRQVAFDESGNSGQNILDPSQPIYVLASVAREESDVAPHVAELVAKSQFDELKFSDMRQTNEFSVLDEVFSSGLLDPSVSRAVPVEKTWMVAGKLVDLLLEPGVVDVHGFYASGTHRKIASLLHFQGPKEVDSDLWARLLESFVTAVRSPRHEANISTLSEALKAAADASKDTAVGVFINEMPSDPKGLVELLGGGEDELDPALSGLVEQLHHWSERLGEPFQVVHDDSGVVRRWGHLLERLSDGADDPKKFEVGDAVFNFPLKAPRISTIVSEESAAVQLADVLAGAVTWCLREHVQGAPLPDQWERWRLGSFIDFFQGADDFLLGLVNEGGTDDAERDN